MTAKLLKPRAHTGRSEAKPVRSVRLSVRSGRPRAKRARARAQGGEEGE